MSKLSKDINKLVETLDSNNKKSGVEVPSESGNRTEEMLTIICGSLAGLVYGDTSADDEKLRQSLGKKPLLFEELAKLRPDNIISKLEVLDTINTNIDKIIDNTPDLLLKSTETIVDKLHECTEAICDRVSNVDIIEALTNNKDNAASKLTISLNNTQDTTKLVEALSQINDETVKRLENLIIVLNKLSEIKLDNLKELSKNTEHIKETVTNINKIDKKELNNAANTLNNINSLVLTAGAILLIGSVLMKVIDPKDLIIFSATLLTFVSSIIIIGTLASKYIDKTIEHMGELGKLVFLCGVTLLLGSYLGRNIEISDYIKFTFALSLFILGTTMPILLFGKHQKEVFANMGDFAALIITASIVMLLGALLINIVPLSSILKFTLTLSLFIALTCLPFLMFSKLNKDVSESANNFNALIITSSICMLFGAFIIQYLNIANILLFTGLYSS